MNSRDGRTAFAHQKPYTKPHEYFITGRQEDFCSLIERPGLSLVNKPSCRCMFPQLSRNKGSLCEDRTGTGKTFFQEGDEGYTRP